MLFFQLDLFLELTSQVAGIRLPPVIVVLEQCWWVMRGVPRLIDSGVETHHPGVRVGPSPLPGNVNYPPMILAKVDSVGTPCGCSLHPSITKFNPPPFPNYRHIGDMLMFSLL